jgi:NAD+ synthase (glutamine-hydrolysing)
VQWPGFLVGQRQELERFAKETRGSATVYVIGLAVSAGGQIFNAAAVVHRGTIAGVVPKEKLPTYNVFYEGRTFSRGGPGLALDWDGIPLGDYRFHFDFGDVAVEVCEDAWSPDGPMRRRCYSGAEIVVNVSTSPYRMGVDSTRREMLATRAADNQALLLYANAVGGQDGLIYDGGGFIFQNGRLVFEAPRFAEGWWSTIVDLDRTRRLRMENTTWRSDCEAFRLERENVPVIKVEGKTADNSSFKYPGPEGSNFLPAAPPSRQDTDPRDRALDDLFEALAIGVKSYYEKTGAFKSLGIALSGGRDSMLTLLVAWRATQLIKGGTTISRLLHAEQAFRRRHEAGGDRPGRGARRHAPDDPDPRRGRARDPGDVDMLGGEPPTELTRQNVQARIRGQRMWNWANSSGALFLQTGDMSEKAVGYTTIGGDLEGALSVIANVPKTVVIALLERTRGEIRLQGRLRDAAYGTGPRAGRHASRRERADAVPRPRRLPAPLCRRKDGGGRNRHRAQVALPDYPADKLTAWAHRFTKLFSQSIYKWVQSPLSLHVGSLDLDRERALQMPVVQKNEWP